MMVLVLQTLAFGSLIKYNHPMLVAPISCAVAVQVQQIQKRMTDLEKIVRTRNITIEVCIRLHSSNSIPCMEHWCKFANNNSSMLQLAPQSTAFFRV